LTINHQAHGLQLCSPAATEALGLMAPDVSGALSRWVVDATAAGSWLPRHFCFTMPPSPGAQQRQQQQHGSCCVLHQYCDATEAGRRASSARKKARLRLHATTKVATSECPKGSSQPERFCFTVSGGPDGTVCWLLSAATETERRRWLAQLQLAVQRLGRCQAHPGPSGSGATIPCLVSPSSSSVLPPIICAPMVLGSELAFRALCRRHGVGLCYTPMLKADKLLAGDAETNQLMLEQPPAAPAADGGPDPAAGSDSPLVLQLCGREPALLARAVRHVLAQLPAGRLDAIDLNLGCPQECAAKGGWGAYLAAEPDLACACVAAMAGASAAAAAAVAALAGGSQQRALPIWCKIRLCDTQAQTVAFAQALERAGCELLAVHCRRRPRTRDEFHDAPPDYSQLAAIVAAVAIPVVRALYSHRC
jgi:tRNA-dihydrouridine synthase